MHRARLRMRGAAAAGSSEAATHGTARTKWPGAKLMPAAQKGCSIGCPCSRGGSSGCEPCRRYLKPPMPADHSYAELHMIGRVERSERPSAVIEPCTSVR